MYQVGHTYICFFSKADVNLSLVLLFKYEINNQQVSSGAESKLPEKTTLGNPLIN